MNDAVERFEQMYTFENDRQLYHYRFRDTEVPMWMYIRSFLITSVIDKELISRSQKNYKNKELVKKGVINRYIRKNPFLTRRKEILFAFWGYNGLSRNDDGLVYDSLIIPYLRMYPDNVCTLMSGNITHEYGMECIHPNWKMDDIFLDILNCVKKVTSSRGICLEDKKNIREFMCFLDKNCPLHIDSNLKKSIIGRLNYFAENSKIMVKIFEIYLDFLKPKVAVVCCGSYPDILKTSMILACKNKKIKTAELQHGILSRYYVWTHYCDFIMENREYSKLLPDYFLLFGEYWKYHVKTPQRCDVIGYAKPIVRNAVSSNDNILFCAGVDFDKYRCFLDRLLMSLEAGTTVYFRFHPIYATDKQKDMFKKYMKYPNFHFANSGSLSSYLGKCHFVIVEGSTVAYEALFAGRIVFAFKGNSSDLAEFNKLKDIHLFDDVDDFMRLWNNRDKLESQCHDEFFSSNYKENYIRFLKKCGVDTSIK